MKIGVLICSFFLTRGIGYYENYKAEQKFSDYGLPNFVVNDSILKRQILSGKNGWIIIFYGQVVSAQYKKTHMR